MKLTDEVAKALQNCVEGLGSVAELSRRTGVRIELLSRYLDRQRSEERRVGKEC